MSERSRLPIAMFCLLSLCGPSCAGTETDNPVVGFERSACKRGSALTLAKVGRTSAALTDGEDYGGLYCVAWEASSDGRLRLDVFNMRGSCAIDWELEDSRYDAKGLRLWVRNDECGIAGCGNCAYDLSFEMEAIDLSAPLPLALRQLDCDDELSEPQTELTLPLDERREGVLCREGGALVLWEGCGKPYAAPCTEGRCGDEPNACGAGLVCDALADPYDTCRSACATDDDCPLPVETCDAGVCRLRETF